MRRPQTKLYAGLDLRSNDVMIAIIDQEGQPVAQSKLACDLTPLTYCQSLRVSPTKMLNLPASREGRISNWAEIW